MTALDLAAALRALGETTPGGRVPGGTESCRGSDNAERINAAGPNTPVGGSGGQLQSP